MEVRSWWLDASKIAGDPQCERATDGPWTEPVAALTSLSFVVGSVLIVLLARPGATDDGVGSAGRRRGRQLGRVRSYAVLVAAVGIGSWIEHGPDPAWSDVAHDLPLLAALCFLGADAAADLTGHARAWWWWALPTAVLLPLVVMAPRLGDLAQVGLAGAAVLLTLLRARAYPELRRPIAVALLVLALGAMIGTLSRAGWPWCDPWSPWQGHGVWHVLAAAALVLLAPTVGHASRRDRY